jgi:hypothetical protein
VRDRGLPGGVERLEHAPHHVLRPGPELFALVGRHAEHRRDDDRGERHREPGLQIARAPVDERADEAPRQRPDVVFEAADPPRGETAVHDHPEPGVGVAIGADDRDRHGRGLAVGPEPGVGGVFGRPRHQRGHRLVRERRVIVQHAPHVGVPAHRVRVERLDAVDG